MTHLRQKRMSLRLSQDSVARQAGISRQHYGRIEQGLALPTREQARLISELLGTAVLHLEQVFPERERRDRSGFPLYALEQVCAEPWRVHEQARGVEMGIDRATWDWLRTFMPADSSYECSGLCDFIRGGARPMVDSPLLWGFDRHLLLDSRGELLGARCLPCLSYQDRQANFVLWPQLRLRTEHATVRLDGLLYFLTKNGRGWLVIEFDGPGHRGGQDLYRARLHGLPEIRFTAEQIRGRLCLQLLLENLLAQAAPKRS